MNVTKHFLIAAVLLAGTIAFAQAKPDSKAAPAPKPATLTGVVTDSMCGASHMMPGKSAAECTRECVKGGSDYALLVGKKVYTLKGNPADRGIARQEPLSELLFHLCSMRSKRADSIPNARNMLYSN